MNKDNNDKSDNKTISHHIIKWQIHLINILLLGFCIISFLYIIKPYLFSKISPYSELGFKTVVIENKQIVLPVAGEFILTKGKLIRTTLVVPENDFGIVLIRFLTFGKINKDIVRFRIKELFANNWYYEQNYSTDQFQNNTYFTFGFPPIIDSKGHVYLIEIESLSGKINNAVTISSRHPQIATVHKISLQLNRENIYNFLQFIRYKLIYTLDNILPAEYFRLIFLLSSIIVLRFTFVIGRLLKLKLVNLLNSYHAKKILKKINKFKRTNHFFKTLYLVRNNIILTRKVLYSRKVKK